MMQAVGLSDEAFGLQKAGNLQAAEAKYLAALRIRIAATGANSIQTALTKNSLGDLYLEMGRLDDAQKNLEEAYEIRK